MPQGKAAGVVCAQLDDELRCRIFGRAERPEVCSSLQPDAAMCGDGRLHAMRWLGELERATRPCAAS